MKKFIILFILALIFQSCASLMSNDEEVKKLEQELAAMTMPQTNSVSSTAEPVVVVDEEPMTRYSEINNMAPASDRQYKRMTRKKMEEESELYSSAGSLWKMEGQTSYLFAENKHRREGDTTSIKMENTALKVVESKVAVISDLLKELEQQKIKAEEDAKKSEEEKKRLALAEEEKKLRAERIAKGEIVVDPMDEMEPPAQTKAVDKKSEEKRQPASLTKKETEEKFDLKEIEIIPSKIVEKMSDDTYRIRGQQYLTIRKKPYKIIATALVKTEDFRDNGISSNKLMDAQYDVIHMKRVE